MEELLTAAETAQILRCSLRTLDRERAVGNGCPFVRLGGRIRYRRSDIDGFCCGQCSRRCYGQQYPGTNAARSRRRGTSKQPARGGTA